MPVEAPNSAEWIGVEAEIGFELPDDYKALIETYGSGAFDGFLWVLNPFSENSNLNLLRYASFRLTFQRELDELSEDTDKCPYPLHPDPNGLYPWAITDNGDIVFWLNKDGIPSHTIIVCDQPSNYWWECKHSSTDFLSLLFSKQLQCKIFPEGIPWNSPVFIRLGDRATL